MMFFHNNLIFTGWHDFKCPRKDLHLESSFLPRQFILMVNCHNGSNLEVTWLDCAGWDWDRVQLLPWGLHLLSSVFKGEWKNDFLLVFPVYFSILDVYFAVLILKMPIKLIGLITFFQRVEFRKLIKLV
jgi:hypothetical protein